MTKLAGAVLSLGIAVSVPSALAGQDPHAGHGQPQDTTAHPVEVQEHAHTEAQGAPPAAGHEMWMQPLGGGWALMGMGQVFPVVTAGAPFTDSPLRETEFYATQPAVMLNLESPGSRLTLRTTLNFEGITLEDGELTYGGWGEGFIDKRHPHTLLHEAMLSLNFWDVAGGALSISAGKGFAPYGTDDPMARPVLKYPTNHHLSQILERWTVNGIYLWNNWSVEAGLFGGAEPTGPYDLSNIESFGDSWSARVTRRFGEGFGPLAPWEVSASYATVRETHDGVKESTFLTNAAVRHAARYGFGDLYALVEGSRSTLEDDEEGYWSLLGETRLEAGRHQPYYRVEYATRPEFHREGPLGAEGFFRYDHDEHAHDASRWLINSAGYAYELTGYPFSARPFVELQHHRVSAERGHSTPEEIFGKESFWALSAGFRLFFGGDPMRMGAYGVLDPMTVMHRAPGEETGHGEQHHHH